MNPTARPNIWILGPLADLVFILNYPLLFLISGTAYFQNFHAELLLFSALVIYPILRHFHTLSPSFTIFFHKEMRSYFLSHHQMKNRSLILVLIPTFIFAFSWCVPWHTYFGNVGSVLNPIGIFAVLYVIASAWHISTQNFGLLTIYRKLTGTDQDFRFKTDAWFCNIVFLILCFAAFLLSGQRLGVFQPFFGSLEIDPNLIRLVLAGFSILATIIAIWIEFRFRPISAPRIIFFTSSTMIPLALFENYILFYFWVLFMNHCMVEVALNSKINFQAKTPTRPVATIFLWLAALAVCSIALEYGSKYNGLLSRVMDLRVARLYAGSLSVENILVGGLIGFVFSVNVFHIYADRILFKSRKSGFPLSVSKSLVG